MKKRVLYYVLLCFGIAGLIHLINVAALGWDRNFLFDYVPFSINFVYALCIGLANIIFFGVLYSYFSWDEVPKKLAIMGVIGSVVVSTLAFFLARVIHFTVILGYTFSEFKAAETVANYVFSMMIAFIITLIYHLVYFYIALKEAKKRELELLNLKQQNEISSLKQQLDPHFLFNNLQVLTSLIEEDKEKAVSFTNELAQVYRYVIQQKDQKLVSLDEEMSFAQSYLQLMTKRFEKGINFNIQGISKGSNWVLVPLSLQLLLENIFKHNEVSESSPLHISLHIENEELIVKNEGNRKKSHTFSTKVGLNNINQQYLQLTGKEISIEKTNTTFVVNLPLIELEK